MLRQNRKFRREDNYGWSIKRGKELDALEEFIDVFGEEETLNSLVQAMGSDALRENLEYIFRQNDFNSSYLK